jgi:hypothetical protein
VGSSFLFTAHHLMDIFQEKQHGQLEDGLNVAEKNNNKILKKVWLPTLWGIFVYLKQIEG